jgi:hypothetical protein
MISPVPGNSYHTPRSKPGACSQELKLIDTLEWFMTFPLSVSKDRLSKTEANKSGIAISQ